MDSLEQIGRVERHIDEGSTVTRGYFDEITRINGHSAADIIARFSDALPEPRVDFDSKGRGDALNRDLYGVDESQGVAVVQIRQAYRRGARHFMSTRKTYVLVGHGEITGQPFRHPVSAAAVRAAIRKNPDDPVAPVRAAQRWMWRVSDRQLARSVRQGDILLVPVRGTPKGDPVEGARIVVEGSHEVRSAKIRRGDDGEIFAFIPTLHHLKEQHDAAYAEEEVWYEVRAAREVDTWDFSIRMGD